MIRMISAFPSNVPEWIAPCYRNAVNRIHREQHGLMAGIIIGIEGEQSVILQNIHLPVLMLFKKN